MKNCATKPLYIYITWVHVNPWRDFQVLGNKSQFLTKKNVIVSKKYYRAFPEKLIDTFPSLCTNVNIIKNDKQNSPFSHACFLDDRHFENVLTQLYRTAHKYNRCLNTSYKNTVGPEQSPNVLRYPNRSYEHIFNMGL